jgi:hypothetical protein
MIDPIRHISVFHPDRFKGLVDVIGCGATGSRMVMGLAKLGVERLRVWDFDKVEEHNIANQLYGNQHIGQFKVDALKEIVESYTGTKIEAKNQKVETEELADVVFLLTDTMASRKEIWDSSIRYKIRTKVMIETRMGTDCGRIYTVNPTDSEHVEKWEGTLCDDAEAETSACGAQVTVGQTAEVISGLAIWQFIMWYNYEVNLTDFPNNEMIFGIRSSLISVNQRW